MTNKNSAENTINPEDVTTDELQDPMSGYTSADALPASDAPTQETHGVERLRDPMSGYTGGDAMKTDPKADPADCRSHSYGAEQRFHVRLRECGQFGFG